MSKQKEIMDTIATKIADKMLETGIPPWHKGWRVSGINQQNAVSKHRYRGINTVITEFSEFKSPYWASFKQVKFDLKGTVKKGEKATTVVFWKKVQDRILDENFFLLRYYNIFNIEQCQLPDNVLEKLTPKPVALTELEKISHCEKIWENYKNRPELEFGGDSAFYSPKLDRITLPPLNQFYTSEEYYSTLFHEMTHSTGHSTRLDRGIDTPTERRKEHYYAKEELVAELGASFLCGIAGISPNVIDNSAAYLKHWAETIKADSNVFFKAASNAQKATDHILGKEIEEEEEEDET